MNESNIEFYNTELFVDKYYRHESKFVEYTGNGKELYDEEQKRYDTEYSKYDDTNKMYSGKKLVAKIIN